MSDSLAGVHNGCAVQGVPVHPNDRLVVERNRLSEVQPMAVVSPSEEVCEHPICFSPNEVVHVDRNGAHQ